MATIERKQRIISAGKDVEKLGPLCTAVENLKRYIHGGTQDGGTSKKMTSPYDLAIPLLDIYSEELRARLTQELLVHLYLYWHYPQQVKHGSDSSVCWINR